MFGWPFSRDREDKKKGRVSRNRDNIRKAKGADRYNHDDSVHRQPAELAGRAGIIRPRSTREKAGASLKSGQASLSFTGDYGYNERITLYRFLRERIPVVNGAVWTWVRLCSSPIEFFSEGTKQADKSGQLGSAVDDLNNRLSPNPYQKSGGLDRLSDLFFSSLFVDGAFAGNIEIGSDGKIAGFTPCDIRNLTFEYEDGWKIYHESESGRTLMDPSTFIYIPLDDEVADPRGRSILQSVGFVSQVEQKLMDDMRKTQEKSGYNRLHVLIKKPERRLGESEANFLERANNYFDDTVGLFSDIKPADSVVTWDDIEIKTVGLSTGGGTGSNSWYLSHRAVVEDICAGVHLDPFMLGYSYGTTRSWARFKFELLLRQVVSVQKQAVRFFEWLINSHLALSGVRLKAAARFNNDRIHGALERYESENEGSKRILDLFQAGLISKEEARDRIFRIEGEN